MNIDRVIKENEFFNTYHYKYLSLINKNKIKVSELVKKQVERWLNIYKKDYFYNPIKVNKVIKFIERECGRTKGEAGLISLTLAQKVWIEAKYGLHKKNGFLLCNHLVLFMGRGSGKTTFASAIANYDLLFGGDGSDVQIIAPTVNLSHKCFDGCIAMTRFESTIFGLLKDKGILHTTKTGFRYERDDSNMQINAAKYETLDGSNCYLNVFDEIHTYKQDFIEITNEGSDTKRQEWCSLYLSTFGTIDSPVFDRYYNSWLKYLDNNEKDNYMIYIYKIDKLTDIKKKENWEKSLPNIYFFGNQLATTQDKINEAKNDTVKQMEIITKRFNYKLDNYAKYFTNEALKKCFTNYKLKGTDTNKLKVILGIDLSNTFDLSVITFLTQKKGIFYTDYLHIKPVGSMLDNNEKAFYNEMKNKDKALVLHNLKTNEPDFIVNEIINKVKELNAVIIGIGYDRWMSVEVINKLELHYGIKAEPITQNSSNISAPLKKLKEYTVNEKIKFKSEITKWNLTNTLVKVDSHNNVYPYKHKEKDKIDALMSSLDALAVYLKEPEKYNFYWS